MPLGTPTERSPPAPGTLDVPTKRARLDDKETHRDATDPEAQKMKYWTTCVSRVPVVFIRTC